MPYRHPSTVSRTTVLVLLVALASCSRANESVASVTTSGGSVSATTMMDMSADEMAAMDRGATTVTTVKGLVGDCSDFMPSDILSSEDAVVVFSEQRVCQAYVTVRPGTTVSWQNVSATDHKVIILDDSGAQVDAVTVAAESTSSQRFDEAGLFRFTLSALPAFTGVVEVVTP